MTWIRSLQRQSAFSRWRNCPIPPLSVSVLGTDLGLRNLFLLFHQPSLKTSKQLPCDYLFFRDCYLTSTPSLQIWPCCSKTVMLKRCQGLPISTLMGRSSQKNRSEIARAFLPNARTITLWRSTEANCCLFGRGYYR